MRQHGDEGIHTEEPDFPTHEVSDPRLSHAEPLSRPLLGQVLLLNVRLNLDMSMARNFNFNASSA